MRLIVTSALGALSKPNRECKNSTKSSVFAFMRFAVCLNRNCYLNNEFANQYRSKQGNTETTSGLSKEVLTTWADEKRCLWAIHPQLLLCLPKYFQLVGALFWSLDRQEHGMWRHCIPIISDVVNHWSALLRGMTAADRYSNVSV